MRHELSMLSDNISRVLRRQCLSFLSKMLTKLIVIFFFVFRTTEKKQERNFKLMTFSCKETNLTWEAKSNTREKKIENYFSLSALRSLL